MDEVEYTRTDEVAYTPTDEAVRAVYGSAQGLEPDIVAARLAAYDRWYAIIHG